MCGVHTCVSHTCAYVETEIGVLLSGSPLHLLSLLLNLELMDLACLAS